MLVTGALIVVFALGIVAGILAMRGSRAGAYTLSSVVGVVGAVAVLSRPAPTIGKLLPTVLGTATSIAVLWWMAPRPSPSVAGTDATPTAQSMELDRRRFMTGAIGIGSAAVIAGGIGRLLQQRFDIGSERAALSLPGAASPVAAAAGRRPNSASRGSHRS